MIEGRKTSEYRVTLFVLAIVAAFLIGAFALEWWRKDCVSFVAGGSVISAVAGIVCHSYAKGRTDLKIANSPKP